ncbi:hypothetical protein CINF_0482 [Candidatus Campylobacter infans]|uniref:Uncharacterized protein n=1 Tax=Candidatus Campylobacter infans TaxID=2561898 RepID=A0A7H9CH67_9BACT|nr:hypothetical protein [Candidatus Campylobacter infans]KAF0589857.1 MAG: hypothetical protein CGEMS_1584 [Candidatus Campylobacter infans]QLI05011.1 hypothetical protein CINF_0482 [Candidatus Campylobacter infans]
MQAINYDKYLNMNERQLLNSLLNAEKKETKIKTILQENSDLISFLKAKLKEKIDRPKYNFVPYKESEAYKIGREREKARTPEQQAQLDREIDELINKNYGNEL